MRQQQQQWKPGRQQQAKAQQQQIGQEATRHLSLQLTDARLLSFLDEAEEASNTMRHFWKDHSVDYLDMIWISLRLLFKLMRQGTRQRMHDT